MLSDDRQRRRQHSFSINPAADPAPKVDDPVTLLRKANALIAVSVLLLLVGLVPLFVPDRSAPIPQERDPIYLHFPHSGIFFLPLLIPLSTYLVIVRWTGEKHYRHS